MTTQTQIQPSIYERDGVYELVWRVFGRKYVNEPYFLYDINDPEAAYPQIRHLRTDVGRWIGPVFPEEQHRGHCFDPQENGFISSFGFLPVPQLGGSLIERDVVRGKPVRRKIFFMDELFLCPNCGRFFKLDDSWIKTPWLDASNGDIEVSKILAAIEDRKNKREFYIESCKGKYCKDITRRLREEFQREAEKAELRAAKAAESANPKPSPNNFVYLISGGGYVKIGIAVHVESRLSGLQTSSPFKLKLLKSWRCLDARSNEEILHGKFEQFRHHREWFQLPDDVLQHIITVEDLDIFLGQVEESNFVKP